MANFTVDNMIAAAIPIAKADWWVGFWATREQDDQGQWLTGYTTLKPDFRYETVLDYPGRGDIMHWGHYEIEIPSQQIKQISVTQQQKQECQQIVQNVEQKFPGRYVAAAVPTGKSRCIRGKIRYLIEDWTPNSADFNSPQEYSFEAIEEGLVIVNGPGANNAFSMRFK
jgi:hypothetical protein